MFGIKRCLMLLEKQVLKTNELLKPVLKQFTERISIEQFYFGCEAPQRVKVIFSLSYPEWCQLEQSGNLATIESLLKAAENQSSTSESPIP